MTAPLSDYRHKRHFEKTSEPKGGRSNRSTHGLSFVIQEHHARRLHYDFRLEFGGTLKSWAVPKGPPTTPGERRLAVHVEDHPLEYGSFEGEIPKGEYGAGTVSIWDRGEWIPASDPAEGLRRGKLSFRLRGRKLRGNWALVEMHGEAGQNGKNWLLIKEHDAGDSPVQEDVEHARRAPMPEHIEPQLATLATHIPEGAQWIHEVKFDGYRILARIEDGAVRLFTRGGKDWTERFPAVAAGLRRLPVRDAWIDGEAVMLDKNGRSDFQALQNALSEGSVRPIYYAFDLPYADGRDLRDTPLIERKRLLAALIQGRAIDRIRFTDHLDGNGEQFYRRACEFALEGVVSKLRGSPYRPGRSNLWMKVKCSHEQEFVIAGFTPPKRSRSSFGSLLLGVMGPRHRLTYCGRVGTGFTSSSLAELLERLEAIEIPRCPFSSIPPDSRGARWVKPVLVAEVAFAGWTRDGVLRQASFHGLREDKPSQEVRREKAAEPPKSGAADPSMVLGVRLTHPGRILYAEQGITKLALARYYEAIADRILPYVVNRPLAVVRCPSGREQNCFYQKHADASFPDSVRGDEIEDKKRYPYLYVENAQGLIGLVQLGALELHGWGCRREAIETPDAMVFDLDPAPDAPWTHVIEGARELRERLRELGLTSFLKTTGGKGLHVVVPLQPDAGWEQVKEFSRQVALAMARENPRLYTAELSKGARSGKVFIDYLRNGRGATAVVPYSPRARAKAPVAAPVAWEELGPKLKPDAFTVSALAARLPRRDPWAGYWRIGQSLRRS